MLGQLYDILWWRCFSLSACWLPSSELDLIRQAFCYRLALLSGFSHLQLLCYVLIDCLVWLHRHPSSFLSSSACHLHLEFKWLYLFLLVCLLGNSWVFLVCPEWRRILFFFCPNNIRWHSDNCVFVTKQLVQIRNPSQQMCFVEGYAKKKKIKQRILSDYNFRKILCNEANLQFI